jgi:Tol biopolymer transport system component
VRKVVDTGVNDYMPQWSPDGLQIVFFAANWPTVRQDIYRINLDGSDLRRLTDTPRVVDEDPRWSPDGRHIVFQSDRDGNFQVYCMDPDGSNQQRLTRNRAQDYWPDWWMPPQAAASDRIVFVADRDGNGEIYVMNSDGSDQQRLTRNSTWDGAPTWSPDGTQIAYYTHRTEQSWALIVMNADGSSPRPLTDGQSDPICAFGPAWSPDGQWIVFTVEPNPRPTCEMKHTEVAIIRIDGSGYTLLTENDFNDLASSWSPDGARLAFSSNRDGQEEIYTMNVDGSDQRRLTDDPATDILPAWSPDGQHIVFVSDRDGDYEIYTMDVDGANLIRLTRNPGWDYWPTWSPDGSLILFSSGADMRSLDLYVMGVDGTNIRRLTDSPGIEFEAGWQP